MAYSHKKSIRTVTDVQMSGGTSVDGSRIDRALDETTERFNNLEPGDFSERFTKTQFVFGMQPSPIVGAPSSSTDLVGVITLPGTLYAPAVGVAVIGGTGAGMLVDIIAVGGGGEITDFTISAQGTGYVPGDVVVPSPAVNAGSITLSRPLYGDISNIITDSKTRPTSGQWLPWLPIINRDTTAHATATGNYPETYNAVGFTPTGGFQNKWRFKGTNVDGRPENGSGGPPFVLSNSMEGGSRWESLGWGDYWSGTSAGAYSQTKEEPAPLSSYQFAWSHSWEFTDPVIIDDIMLFVRTDRPWLESTAKYNPAGVTSASGWYDAPYQHIQEPSVGSFIFSTRDVMFQLSIDNEFSKEKRNLNDIEATFNSRPLDGWRVGQEGSVGISYSDMMPYAPGYDAPLGVGDGLEGRMIRFSNLNIPIRQMARVRLSVILPWYKPQITAAAFQTQVKMSRGMSPSRWDAELDAVPGNSKTAETSPTGEACLLGAPWDNCSINGCLTVLEDVES